MQLKKSLKKENTLTDNSSAPLNTGENVGQASENNLKYNIIRPWLTLDKWQKEYISTTENCFLLCGRQSGKSAAMSIKAGVRAATKPNSQILIVAFTEKQAYQLFFKTLIFLEARYKHLVILKGKDKPTQHRIKLRNGSVILCYATGERGDGLRGFTITDLFMDECRKINDEVWTSLSPMLSVTGGTVDMSSTPAGKQGFFYECSKRDDFKKFYVSAEDCPRHSKKFLDAEKANMSELEYAQEYLAMFLDDLKRFYSDELIERCCVLKRDAGTTGRFYCGVDIAGMGADLNSFEIIQKIDNDNYRQVENITTKKQYTTETTQKILELNKKFNFKKIGVDDMGVGFGVFSELLRERVRVEALNNSRRSLDRDGKKSKRILKEDMYFNLKTLMEQGKIGLLDDDDVIDSLKSIQWELIIKEGYPTRTRIFGRDSHIAEGLIRSAWLAYQDKTLNIWATSISHIKHGF